MLHIKYLSFLWTFLAWLPMYSSACGSCSYTGQDFSTFGCASGTTASLVDISFINADHLQWEQTSDAFCRVIHAKVLNADTYFLAVDLYNIYGWQGVNSGHLGVLYNAQDPLNFDFLYFRPHGDSQSRCLQTGHVTEGKAIFSQQSDCPHGFHGHQWHQLTVEVNKRTAIIALDGDVIMEKTTQFPSRGAAGVLVANGYANSIYFKNFEIFGSNVSFIESTLPQPDEFLIKDCNNQSVNGEIYTLDANHGTSQAQVNSLCRMYWNNVISGGAYELDVYIRNVNGWEGQHSGHPGVQYNMKDENNFDFIYFRPHSATGCFQTGHVMNGIVHTGVSSSCNIAFRGQQWYSVKVKVAANLAVVYLEGQLLTISSNRLPVRGMGGVFTWNGYSNIIQMTGFDLYPSVTVSPTMTDADFDVNHCVSGNVVNGILALDARNGSWAHDTSGFCRAVWKEDIAADSYQIQVFMYNVNGWQGVNSGHLGVIYNVQDGDNFEFIYFRPHSSTGCFQVGYVRNSTAYFLQSSKCPVAFTGKQWYKVNVKVGTTFSKVMLNDKEVVTISNMLSTRGSGGILVGNGYQNIVHFTGFSLQRSLTDNVLSPTPVADFTVQNCVNVAKSGEVSTIDARHGSHSSRLDALCRLYWKGEELGAHYEIEVNILNQAGWQGVNSGHPGIFYNAQSDDTFEFVYFRPHSSSTCFQTGHYENGTASFIQSASCSMSFKGNQWYNIKAKVTASTTTIYLDQHQVTVIHNKFPARGKGGILVWNGYQNVVQFSNFNLKRLTKDFVLKGCAPSSDLAVATHDTSSIFIMDGGSGTFTSRADAFCQAHYISPHQDTSGVAYSLKVDLLNVQGWQGIHSGHLGFMYNVQDNNNFEFFYLRPHSDKTCYQYGYAKDGQAYFQKTNFCPVRVYGDRWYTVKATVSSEEATIFLNNHKVLKLNTNLSFRKATGVIVAKGYKNKAIFKDFEVLS